LDKIAPTDIALNSMPAFCQHKQFLLTDIVYSTALQCSDSVGFDNINGIWPVKTVLQQFPTVSASVT